MAQSAMIRRAARRPVLPCALLLVASLCVIQLFAEPTTGESIESYELRLRRASSLAQAHAPNAVAEIQKLLKERPKDGRTLLQMGLALADQAHQLPAGAPRRAALKEARYFIVRAQQAGLDEPIIATILREISPEGIETVREYSKNAEAEGLLRQAETAFEKHDYTEAQRLYRAVLIAEPAHYMARMGIGDAFYAAGRYKEAIEWFEQAAALDPDQAIAYRYCGDALLRLGRRDDALEKYLSAVIANPYDDYTFRALQACCQAMLLKPWIPAQKIPSAEVKDGVNGPEIILPQNYSALHLAYALSRSRWQTENKAKRFPSGCIYRLTLEEEQSALSSLIKIFHELKDAKQSAPADVAKALAEADSSMEQLADIEKAGLLPAHILLFRANKDIAQDYVAYRSENRARLREYLIKYYLHIP